MAGDKIVSVGFLSEDDLRRLGEGFDRHFAVDNDDIFADILAKLDAVTVEPLDKGIVMIAPKPAKSAPAN